MRQQFGFLMQFAVLVFLPMLILWLGSNSDSGWGSWPC